MCVCVRCVCFVACFLSSGARNWTSTSTVRAEWDSNRDIMINAIKCALAKSTLGNEILMDGIPALSMKEERNKKKTIHFTL